MCSEKSNKSELTISVYTHQSDSLYSRFWHLKGKRSKSSKDILQSHTCFTQRCKHKQDVVKLSIVNSVTIHEAQFRSNFQTKSFLLCNTANLQKQLEQEWNLCIGILLASRETQLYDRLNPEELWQRLQDASRELPAKLPEKLRASAPMVNAALNAKDGHTKCWFNLVNVS